MATRPLPRRDTRERRRANLRVVRGGRSERTRRTRASVPIVVLAALTVFAVAVLQAWMGQEGLKAADLERKVSHQTEQVTLLRAKVAQLETPQRILDEARRLGLQPDADPAFVREAGIAPVAEPRATKTITSPTP